MEIPDAYQEYVRVRRENEEIDKIATLALPESQMRSVWSVLAQAVDTALEELPVETRRKWESILRSVATSINEAA